MVYLIEFLCSHAVALPTLAKFAMAMAIIVCVPRLSRQVHLPAVVGLLFSGIAIGPHGLDVIGTNRPIADFFADLGKLLLMFCAGVEAAPIIAKFGATRLEPIAVTVGATVVSDTLSLVVLAICVATFQRGFSVSALAVQLVEITIFVPLILLGLSRLGAYLLRKVADDENAYFILMLAVMTVAAALAALISLPGIVGAFLAGLAVNAAVHDKPAKEKLKSLGDSLFIPIFFVVTGFLIDPREFYQSITDNLALASAVVLALLAGKRIAAQIAGRPSVTLQLPG